MDANPDIIKKNYYDQVKIYHPDINQLITQDGNEKIKLLNIAYDILSDESTRREYDFYLKQIQSQENKQLDNIEQILNHLKRNNIHSQNIPRYDPMSIVKTQQVQSVKKPENVQNLESTNNYKYEEVKVTKNEPVYQFVIPGILIGLTGIFLYQINQNDQKQKQIYIPQSQKRISEVERLEMWKELKQEQKQSQKL